MKKLCVLGGTGSIGTQTLDIVRSHPDLFSVVSLTCGRNLDIVREQIKEFNPQFVSVAREEDSQWLKSQFPDVKFAFGKTGNCEAVTFAPEIDTVVVGIVGFEALAPTLTAIREKKRIALANKEVLVVAGSFIKREIEKHKPELIPVDSEHNGLFQLLDGRPREQVASLVITASGGPLLKRPELPLHEVTPEIAVKHPNWKMGPKISVDSATLMNKGLELIETHFLFSVPEEQIEVWVHPQSIIHSAVWLKDNSCLAQLTAPDMRCSIGYALHYPHRLDKVISRFSIRELQKLEFFEPDLVRFPALRIAREALKAGPGHLIALNASNEVVVNAFLERRLLFPQITQICTEVLETVSEASADDLETIMDLDRKYRETTNQKIDKLANP